ncbi:actin-related protein Arp6 [Cristinia sonorae]|uniref:Actin-like protein ARP6 n=1 Tax=Cristinia sonorae TaxID=1940300 RepID=A0A8K0UHW6_9AGAR|nr:actin-related protein Arp6 [Cristinia sonorae]
MRHKTIVLDNGGHTIKLGMQGVNKNPRIVHNGVFRSDRDKITYVGKELDGCTDFGALNYRLPFEKGYLVDWDVQKAVWDGLMYGKQLGVDPPDASLLITEPYFDLPKIQDVYDQFVFEEYEFKSYYRCTPASMVPYGDLFSQRGLPPPECMIVVDCGFSFTHVVPIMSGSIVWNAVKRIDIGGKVLTNHLKELISFRQWNMMDETYVINEVKEACCYVSQNFKQELELCKANPQSNPIVCEYILPDYSPTRTGRIRQPGEQAPETAQILSMGNERFTVPEIVFRPDDIGMEQMGLAATIAHTISLLPEDLQGMFWANIGLIGGSTKFPGFKQRLITELRALAPVDCMVELYQATDPIVSAYTAAYTFASQPAFQQRLVTRAEYLESGSSACRRKFKDWKGSTLRGNDGVSGKGKGRAREDTTDSGSEETEEAEVVPVKKGTKGKGRASVGRPKDK